jgi:hypothetical protein
MASDRSGHNEVLSSDPRFDSELIRIESGRLEHARTFFPDPIESP